MSKLKLKICIEVLEKTLIEKECVGVDYGVQEVTYSPTFTKTIQRK